MVVEIRLFGALRKYGNDGMLSLEIPEQCAATELKALLKRKLEVEFSRAVNPLLIERSAVASGNRLVCENERVPAGVVISILPPVCGG